MKAVSLTGPRRMDIHDVDEPSIVATTDVLLEVHTVGVCGSDMHYFKEGRIGCQVIEYPWIVGHECAGRVLEVGADVEGLQPGRRVAVDPLLHCGRCDQCRLGHIHTCRNQQFLGCPGQKPGSLCERLVMPATSVFPIPDNITMTQATLTEPFAIALWAQRLSEVADGMKVGIFGSGPIGLTVLAACKAAADCTVYQTDLIGERLEMARRFGADWVGNPRETNVVADILAAEPDGLDVVFECAGEQETVDHCLDTVKPCSKVLIVGIPATDRLSFEMNHMRRKEVRIQNVRRQLDQTERAIEMVATGEVDLDPLATHDFDLDGALDAFDLVADYRDGVMKAMIHVTRDA